MSDDKNMTMRDEFAKAALQGICTDPYNKGFSFSRPDEIVKTAYKLADFMCYQRNMHE